MLAGFRSDVEETKEPMALHFPNVRDIPLQHAPLTEVVCQVRFPAILKITQTQPVEFQELIRKRFPVLEVEHGIRIGIPKIVGDAQPDIESTEALYRFRSPSDPIVVTLARDFYSISTASYSNWLAFSETLTAITQAVTDVYGPSYSTRVGLRYVNSLTLANTHSSSTGELIDFPRSELTVLLRNMDWGLPERLLTESIFADESGTLKFRSGFIQQDDGPAILLDFDFFEEGQISLNTVTERTTRYHDKIYSAFRWCIPDDKLEVFSPII